jgi:hypothetical protein
MAHRTIYNTSEVTITAADAGHGIGDTTERLLNAVTSATYTTDTPREQVNVFGKKGQVDTVQNESTTSTIEVVFHPWNTDNKMEGPDPADVSANHITAAHVNSMMADSALDDPKFVNVKCASVGTLTNALLTSLTAEGSVGALPTITMSFDGVGSANTEVVTADTASYDIATMTNVKLITAGSGGNSLAWAQSATFNWEMPVEKLNKLGNSVNAAVSYGVPPGSASISVEGTENAGNIQKIAVADLWFFALDSDSAVANVTNNLAVGEVGATYNTTTEGVADGCEAKNSEI